MRLWWSRWYDDIFAAVPLNIVLCTDASMQTRNIMFHVYAIGLVFKIAVLNKACYLIMYEKQRSLKFHLQVKHFHVFSQVKFKAMLAQVQKGVTRRWLWWRWTRKGNSVKTFRNIVSFLHKFILSIILRFHFNTSSELSEIIMTWGIKDGWSWFDTCKDDCNSDCAII